MQQRSLKSVPVSNSVHHPAINHPAINQAADPVSEPGSNPASNHGSAGSAEPKATQPNAPTHNAPTNIRPAPDAQLQKLAMLEGSARLRVAEQRVRHGLVDPPIRVQPSAATSLHSTRHTRNSGTGYVPDAPKAKTSRLRVVLVVLALLLIGIAAALHWLR